MSGRFPGKKSFITTQQPSWLEREKAGTDLNCQSFTDLDKSAARFCRKMAARVAEMFCNFY
jgi:hypothetical protein